MPDGNVVRGANGQIIAWVYARASTAEGMQAKVLTLDEARLGQVHFPSILASKKRAQPLLDGYALNPAIAWGLGGGAGQCRPSYDITETKSPDLIERYRPGKKRRLTSGLSQENSSGLVVRHIQIIIN